MLRYLLILLFILVSPAFFSANYEGKNEKPALLNEQSEVHQLYAEMNLKKTIDFLPFQQAIEGYYRIKEKKKEIITLIDFTKPSTKERLYVLDIKNKKILYSSLVAHGKNSGGLYATSFSNRTGSHQSSLGFYLTENTYTGRNGYSLILKGLEKGINDKAKERSIVVHGASYSNPSVIASSGRLGRSLGCPALPEHNYIQIINTIKDGSLLFIYANNHKYLSQSSILKRSKVA